ncbi:unnamed protein product [Phaeothamnion confervicola]
MAEHIEAALRPFTSVQMMLEGDHYVTSSLTIPTIHDLREGLRDWIAEASASIAAAAATNGEDAPVQQAIFAIITKTFQAFNDKFGYGAAICRFAEGHRRQPRGFMTDQVLATACDACTEFLYSIPATEHGEVRDLVHRAGIEVMLKKWEKRRAANG